MFLSYRTERKLGDQRRSDTVLVLTINYADSGSGARNYQSSAPYEKSKSLGSGGSMVARLKLKGIDGRAPPGVELAAQFDSTRENLPGPDIVRIDRLRVLS